MLKPKSFFRLILVAKLLLIGLLFPTLHFHPGDDHAHDSHGTHHHGVVHADFLAALVNGGEHAHERHDGGDSGWRADGIGLRALTSSRVEFSALPFGEQMFLPEREQPLGVVTIRLHRALIKQQSPPHTPKVYRLGSPRSPPSFV